VRNIENCRAAVAAMREEEAARRRGVSVRTARDRDRQRDPASPARGEAARRAGESGVRRVNTVAEGSKEGGRVRRFRTSAPRALRSRR
jgi:hypothetical protein